MAGDRKSKAAATEPERETNLGRKIRKDAETMWGAVACKRDRLHSLKNAPLASLGRPWAMNAAAVASLERAWALLDRLYSGEVKRDEKTGTTPFEAIQDYVGKGFYPPPELLLTVYDGYVRYVQAAGKITLEEVLFGRPKRKSGGFALRNAQYMKLLYMANMISHLVGEGHTRIRAAEIISNEFAGKPDAASIIRTLDNDSFLKMIMKPFKNPRKRSLKLVK